MSYSWYAHNVILAIMKISKIWSFLSNHRSWKEELLCGFPKFDQIFLTWTFQTLTFYELDLGLNHVVRKYSEPLEEHANMLISVPGGADGPSGVLVCSENYITYKNLGDQPDIRCPIPRRRVSCLLDKFSHVAFWDLPFLIYSYSYPFVAAMINCSLVFNKASGGADLSF